MSSLSPPKKVSSIEAKVVVLGSQGTHLMHLKFIKWDRWYFDAPRAGKDRSAI